MSRVSISVIVPLYRSGNTIEELLSRLDSSLKKLSDYDYEIILVNDGSGDNTLSNALEFLGVYDKLSIIDLNRNFGQLNATLAGFSKAKGDILISIDDDLQYHPEDIKLLLDQMGNNYDVVYGIPKKTNQSFYRSIGSKFVNYVYRRLFHRNHNRSSFAAIRKTIVKSILNHEESLHFIDGLVLWYTDKISTVEISQSPRKHGSSGWKLKSLIRATMDMITNYSRTPLLLSTWISFITSFFGMMLALGYIIYTLMIGNVVPGWASIFVSIAFFSSTQLFSLGMMGEYISRLQINSNNKPRYLIREVFKN